MIRLYVCAAAPCLTPRPPRGHTPVDEWTGFRYSQPLLEPGGEVLDKYTQHPSLLPLVELLLGKGKVRFSEFNLRDTPAGAGSLKMGFHHDAAYEDRDRREPVRQRGVGHAEAEHTYSRWLIRPPPDIVSPPPV